MERLLVVVPAYNEEASIGTVLADIRAVVPDAGILVVDDGSSDDTRRVALAQQVHVLTLPFNLGVGGAMRAGFRFAVRNGYTQVIQVDADGQHDPKQIPMLVGRLSESDIVIGARFAGAGDYQARGPRRWAMRLLAWYLTRLTHARLTDATSGFRASGPRAVELFARHYPVEYLGDTVESLVIAALAGLRVEQVAVTMRVRSTGRPSQTPFKAMIYLLRACMALAMARLRWRSKRLLEIDELAPVTNHKEDSI
ncbi:MAG TPA: glycosyltransferase family 2 protein [Leifsonia sp.]|jgi:glycosyltransferase involved in cell wall biosynthesis